MSRDEMQLLQAICDAQRLAIHYTRNADYMPHACYLGKERTQELARMATGLWQAIDAAIGEQHQRAEEHRRTSYEVHDAD